MHEGPAPVPDILPDSVGLYCVHSDPEVLGDCGELMEGQPYAWWRGSLCSRRAGEGIRSCRPLMSPAQRRLCAHEIVHGQWSRDGLCAKMDVAFTVNIAVAVAVAIAYWHFKIWLHERKENK